MLRWPDPPARQMQRRRPTRPAAQLRSSSCSSRRSASRGVAGCPHSRLSARSSFNVWPVCCRLHVQHAHQQPTPRSLWITWPMRLRESAKTTGVRLALASSKMPCSSVHMGLRYVCVYVCMYRPLHPGLQNSPTSVRWDLAPREAAPGPQLSSHRHLGVTQALSRIPTCSSAVSPASPSAGSMLGATSTARAFPMRTHLATSL